MKMILKLCSGYSVMNTWKQTALEPNVRQFIRIFRFGESSLQTTEVITVSLELETQTYAQPCWQY